MKCAEHRPLATQAEKCALNTRIAILLQHLSKAAEHKIPDRIKPL